MYKRNKGGQWYFIVYISLSGERPSSHSKTNRVVFKTSRQITWNVGPKVNEKVQLVARNVGYSVSVS